MKRVGILTLYHKTYNFGAQLQAYALQKTIEGMGYACEQIRFIWSREETIEGYENASINQKKFAEFSNGIKHSRRIYNADNIADCVDDYDAFVVGSDQVWGVEHSMPLMKLPVMTLSFVPNEKVKIAYAASMGRAAPVSGIKEVIKNELGKLDAISVREKTAADYLSGLVGRDISTALDPVFLLEKEIWNTLASDAESDGTPYIFFYTTGADPRQDEIIDGISKELDLPLKRLSYISGERIGPKEFVAWIKNAEYVVTDSFHATAFSILYHKQFITLPVERAAADRNRNVRLIDLLDMLDLADRYMNEDRSIGETAGKLTETIPYEQKEILLARYRTASFDFLERSLSIEKGKDEYPVSRERCTGCGVCSLVCPEDAIRMEKDAFGFVYPVRNKDNCTACGKCRDICNNTLTGKEDRQAPGLLRNNDEIRRGSSPPAVFYELASYILKNNGIVAACRNDPDFQVVHDFCFSEEGLDAFFRPKHVQSSAYKIFQRIKEYLEDHRTVLFVGAPCQTSALAAFLGALPERLYLIDFICEGVSAPELWDKYLKYIDEHGTTCYEDRDDLFSGSRLSFCRDSCYICPYKGAHRESDITIGDFVGTNKLLSGGYGGHGTAPALVHTSKGRALLNNCGNAPERIPVTQSTAMLSEQPKRKPQHYYMRSIFNNSTIEKLFYEDRLWDGFNAKESLLRNFYNELKRNELLLKIERFILYRLWIDENPNISGSIYIYGAGKLGRRLVRCTHHISGFVDKNTNMNSCEGIPVYHPGTDEIRERLKEERDATLIVTPVWDYGQIEEAFQGEFSGINVVSLNDIVGDIWI